MECIFCKIAAGEIPSLKILENDRIVSFLDIRPLADGHLLIIPKRHYGRLEEVSPDDLKSVAEILPKLAQALVRATGAAGYNLLQNNGACAGQEVEHVHFHLIPRRADDGLGYRWNPKKYAEGKDKKMQQKLLAELP